MVKRGFKGKSLFKSINCCEKHPFQLTMQLRYSMYRDTIDRHIFVMRCDKMNFISGFEMQLETALRLRRVFPGPIYADFHSLFLGVAADGLRTPQALPNVSTWFSCFDAVQLNQDEMGLVGADPLAVAAIALGAGVGLLIVTLEEQGAVYFSVPSYTFERKDPAARRPTGPVSTARVPAQQVDKPLDPTGCGDVFGATVVSYLAQGVEVAEAISRGNTSAASNLSHRGATHLQRHLKGKLVVQ